MKAGKREKVATATAVILFTLVMTACIGGDDAKENRPEQAIERKGTLIIGEMVAFPENLSPLAREGTSAAAKHVVNGMFPSPFRILPDLSFAVNKDLMGTEPTIEETDGQQVVTYEINPDAVWSDGVPISADDFQFVWRLQRSSDPAVGGCAGLVSTAGYDQIQSVVGSDNGKLVKVTYLSPYGNWKDLFSLFPAHVMDMGDAATNCTATLAGWPTGRGIPQDISSGPWQLLSENIDPGVQTLILTPNPRWYGEGPFLESLVHRSLSGDADMLVRLLESREIDMIATQPQRDLITTVRDLDNVTSEVSAGLAFEHFDLNTANVHLAKPGVRRAFALALDREVIAMSTVGEIYEEARVMNNHLFINTQREYVDNAPEQLNTQDLTSAKQLLESAGYVLGAGGIFEHPRDGPLSLTMSTLPDDPLRKRTIDLAAAQVAEAGFGITRVLDPGILGGPFEPTSLASGGFDIVLFAWVSSPAVSGNVSLYKTGGGQNYAGVSNAEVDSLLDQLASEVNPETAAQLANEADEILWEELVTIPLYQKPIYTVWSNEFEGIVPNPTSAGPMWNSDEWKLAE